MEALDSVLVLRGVSTTVFFSPDGEGLQFPVCRVSGRFRMSRRFERSIDMVWWSSRSSTWLLLTAFFETNVQTMTDTDGIWRNWSKEMSEMVFDEFK